MNVPCKNCLDRHMHCHAECPRYQAYHEERLRICEEKKNAKEFQFLREEKVAKAERQALRRKKSLGI